MTLGVYIQVPFCQTKCTYCNFHTGVVSRDRYQPYAAALCREIVESSVMPELTVDTVYWGGGTPSLLDPASLASILDTLRQSFRLASADAHDASNPPRHPEPAHVAEEPASALLEVTLEADPETITRGKASAWLAAGFNRISLGAQSFHDLELKSAGRMHRRNEIFQAIDVLRRAGLRNIGMDLIAGLPHQTQDSWETSLTELLRIRPQHVSIYMLEIDEGSRLGKESLAGGSRYSAGAIPSEDAMAAFYESACARLAADSYEHYEISNWALPGFRSRHNLKYWRRAPYLGFGAGAHSFDGTTRWANVHDTARFVACIEQGISPREQIEAVTPAQALDEELFLGLRQLEGIDLARIEREYDTAGLHDRVAGLRNRIRGLASHGLVDLDGTRVRIAPTRLTVSNEVFVELLG
jgi:oxygen-independent coproporphyrinogen III oxidase